MLAFIGGLMFALTILLSIITCILIEIREKL
jgi:hypothetical protein